MTRQELESTLFQKGRTLTEMELDAAYISHSVLGQDADTILKGLDRRDKQVAAEVAAEERTGARARAEEKKRAEFKARHPRVFSDFPSPYRAGELFRDGNI